MFKVSLNGMRLFWAALGVLRREPVLLLFVPLWSLALAGMLGLMLLVMDAAGSLDRISTSAAIRVPDVLFIAFAYLLTCFATLYVSATLISAMYHRLEGGSSTLINSFDAANERLGSICVWSAFAGTLGFLMKPSVRSNSRLLGRTVSAMLGRDFSAASALVLPTMLIEEAGPQAALGRANELFSEIWGDGAKPRFNLGIVLVFLGVIAASASVGVYVLIGSLSLSIGLAAILLLLSLGLFRVCQAVVALALYYFAVAGDHGIVPAELLTAAYGDTALRRPRPGIDDGSGPSARLRGQQAEAARLGQAIPRRLGK